MKIAICLIAKNENEYLEEWLEYHQSIGIDHFFIYDNYSSKPLVEEPWLCKYPVTYTKWNVPIGQLPAYKDCLKYTEYDWIAFIDADEFIGINDYKNIKDFLAEYDNYSGVCLNWMGMSNDNQQTKLEGKVQDRFPNAMPTEFIPNMHVKSIVRPSLVSHFPDPHHCIYKSGNAINMNGTIQTSPFCVPVNHNRPHIKHYYTKSYEEYVQRCAKGRCDCNVAKIANDFDNWRIK